MRQLLSLERGRFIIVITALACCLLQQSYAQTKTPEPIINFFGKGEIQKSLDSGDDIPASTGLGVVYSQWYPNTKDSLLFRVFDKLELEAYINVASTVDTVEAEYYSPTSRAVVNTSAFGSSILTPLNSGQAVKMGLRLNLQKDFFFHLVSGLKVKYVGSNRNWNARDSVGGERVVQATISAFRLGIFHEFLKKELLLNDMSINFSVYLAYNSLKGDIGLNRNKDMRDEILTSRRKHFVGPETSLEIRLKNLRAEFAYSWLAPNKSEVPGLTGGRLVTTISFVGGFGLKLKKD